MIVTIHQPEYLPWLPFFDRIQQSDVFVVLDDVGYQKNGFINRNKIKTKDGWSYLTVPVLGRSPNKKIKESYSSAPYFTDYYLFFEESLREKWEKISDLDMHIIKHFLDLLGIKVQI